MVKIAGYRFSPEWIPSLAVLLLLSLLLSLGLWQLNRADQKRALIELQQSRRDNAAIRLEGERLSDADLRYRKVLVSGEYDTEHQFLLDNQVKKGQPGFYLLTPLKIDHSNQALLVNRGWIPMDADRKPQPDITLTGKKVTLSGRLDHFPGVGYRMAGIEIPTEGWPAIVLLVDETVLSERLGLSLMRYQLLLDASEEEGFLRDWKLADPRITPEKHIGYAVQWFSLALLLLLFYLWRSFKRDE